MVEASVEIATEVPSSIVPRTVSLAIWVQVPAWSVKTYAAPWSLTPGPAAPGAAVTKVRPLPDIDTDVPNCSSASGSLGVSSAVWENVVPAVFGVPDEDRSLVLLKTYTAPALLCSGAPTAVTAPLLEGRGGLAEQVAHGAVAGSQGHGPGVSGLCGDARNPGGQAGSRGSASTTPYEMGGSPQENLL